MSVFASENLKAAAKPGRQSVPLIVLLVAVVGLLGTPLLGQEKLHLTPTEQFVLDGLRNDGEADFDETDSKDRTIRHEFLEQLIRGSYTNAAIAAYGINLSNATIKGTLNVTDATVPFPVRFSRCKFNDGVDFSYDKFGHDLSFDESVVGAPARNGQSPDTSALFIGVKVEGTLNLHGTYFYSEVNFTYAEIGSEFLADEVHFESPKEVDFDSIRTKAPIFLRRSYFGGRLNLTDSELFSVQLENAVAPAGSPSGTPGNVNLDISQGRIAHGLEVKNVAFTNLQAGFLNVEGPTDFQNVILLGRVDLSYSHFQSLTINGFDEWLQRGTTNDFRLEGISFDGIEIPNAPVEPPAMRMLDLIDSPHCPYSPQPYLELEKFLRSHGSPAKADQTYINMRRKERAHLSFWKRPFDWMLEILVGYGKRPWRSGFGVLALIILGVIVFRRDRMVHEDDKSTDEWYNRFWFSLDLLSPIDLGVSKKWRAMNPLLRNYAQMHRIAGWVLIPLIAAAITGIIK